MVNIRKLKSNTLYALFFVTTYMMSFSGNATAFEWSATACSDSFFDAPGCWTPAGGPPGQDEDARFLSGSSVVRWDRFTLSSWQSTTGSSSEVITNTVVEVSSDVLLRTDGFSGSLSRAQRTYDIGFKLDVRSRSGTGGMLTLGAPGSQGIILTAEEIDVGGSDRPTLIVSHGSELTTKSLEIAFGPGSAGNDESGSVTVRDAGSRIDLAGGIFESLVVGEAGLGLGEFNVEAGATVTSEGTTIGGAGLFGNGIARLTDPGSSWTNTDTFSVGERGIGELVVQNGASLDTTDGATLGDATDSQGTARVLGTNASWIFSGESLVVGREGTGIVRIENGGVVSGNTSTVLGNLAGSRGEMTVVDAGSSHEIPSLVVGGVGDGSLLLDKGGAVTVSLNATIAGAASSDGEVRVMRTGSLLDIEKILTVGDSGNGNLSIESGGRVNNADALVGALAGSQGTVVVTGTGSAWINTVGLSVGVLGKGNLLIENDGSVTAGESLFVGANGNVTLNSGTLTVGKIEPVSGGDIELNAGTLNVTTSDLGIGAGRPLGAFVVTTTDINVFNGNFIVDSGAEFTTSGDLSANRMLNNGNVNHLGGTTVIDIDIVNAAGASMGIAAGPTPRADYGQDRATAVRGDPSVAFQNDGNLTLNNIDLIADLNATSGSTTEILGEVTIWGTLNGDATLVGPGNATVLGGVSPGSSPGTVSVEGALTLGNTAITVMELGGIAAGQQHDQVLVGEKLNLAGRLEITLLDGNANSLYQPSFGDVFVLFSAQEITGAFDQLLLPGLGPELDWLVHSSLDTFALEVTAVPLPAGVWLLFSGVVSLMLSRRREVPRTAAG